MIGTRDTLLINVSGQVTSLDCTVVLGPPCVRNGEDVMAGTECDTRRAEHATWGKGHIAIQQAQVSALLPKHGSTLECQAMPLRH